VFIFIQSVPGMPKYTGCCSAATSKTMCLSLYKLFQECQCIQSVVVLSRARLCVFLYTKCSRKANVYRALQCCHEQDCMFTFIQSVPGVPMYTGCCSVPPARLCVFPYTECSSSSSVYRVLQCVTSKTMCFVIQRVPGLPVYTECCSVPRERLFAQVYI
jgi:hypothetical protein